MFGRKKTEEVKDNRDADILRLEDEKKDLTRVVDSLQREKKKLHESVERLKLEAKLKDEDIKHMIKMREEAQGMEHKKRMGELEIEFEKKKAVAELDKTTEIGAVKDEYRDKMEVQLREETKEVRKVQSDILAILPRVNVDLSRPVVEDTEK